MARDRGRRVLEALAEYPGGANLSVLAEDLPDLTRPDINSALTYLVKKGRVTRSGQRGGYVYALANPDFSMPGDAPARPKTAAKAPAKRKAKAGPGKVTVAPSARKLAEDDPRVIVARSAALMLPPELRGHLVDLADWATGKQTTH